MEDDLKSVVIERDRLRDLVATLAALSASPLPAERLTAEIVTAVQRLTRATGAVLELVDGAELFYRVATGTVAPFVGLRLPKDGSLSGACVARRHVMYTADAQNDPRVHRDAAQRIGAHSMMVVPLVYGTRAVGVLKSVSAEPDAFDAIDEATLVLAAQFIAGLLVRQAGGVITPE